MLYIVHNFFIRTLFSITICLLYPYPHYQSSTLFPQWNIFHTRNLYLYPPSVNHTQFNKRTIQIFEFNSCEMCSQLKNSRAQNIIINVYVKQYKFSIFSLHHFYMSSLKTDKFSIVWIIFFSSFYHAFVC